MNADIQALSPESLTIISYQGMPVITTDILAGIYATDDVRIRQNYSRNTDRFIDGKHFFKLENGELREFKKSLSSLKLPCEIPRQAKSLMLWTERGAARHAKMLDTDQAWDVFERLEDCYFGRREPEANPTATLPPPKTKKALPGGLTCEQQDAVKALVKSRVEACPKPKQGAAAVLCWSSIKSKFKCSYKEVPAEHFGEVLSLVARLDLPIEGELMPPAPQPLAYSLPAEQARQIDAHLDRVMSIFHPHSHQFTDLLGVKRLLHGCDPRGLGPVAGFVAVLPHPF